LAENAIAGAPPGGREAPSGNRPARSWWPLGFYGLFVLILSAKAYLLRRFVFGPSHALAGAWWEIGVIVLLLALGALIARRGRAWTLLGIDLVVSLAMFATVVYAAFYRDIGTAAALGVAGEAGAVTDSIARLIRPTHGLFLIDVIVLAAVFAVFGALRRRADGREPRFAALVVAGLLFTAVPVVRVLGVTGMVDGMAVARANGILPYQVASVIRDPQGRGAVHLPSARAVPDSAQAAETTSSMPGGAISPLQAEINRVRGSEGERFVEFLPGSAKGKNLLIIQSEAVQSFLVGARVDGVEVTPNLNKLAAESYYFPHTVVSVGKGTTVDAEFLVNTGVYPPGDRPSSYIYSGFKLPSLPRLLGDAGYTTATFHTDVRTFWRRNALYPALGWEKIYDRDFFGANNDVIGIGPSDEALFAKTLPELTRLHGAGKPFYAMVITLSAHYPFAPLPASKHEMQLPAMYQGTLLGGYLQRQSYADQALGQFLDGLKSSGLWDDTIVVFYGDHVGIPGVPSSQDARALEAVLGRGYTQADIMQVPLIVRMPGQGRGVVVTDTAGQIDILPTVADPLGIDLSQTPYFGRNLWGHGDPFVVTRLWVPNGSAATNRGLFVPGDSATTGRWYSLQTGLPTSGPVPAKPVTDRVTAMSDLSAAYINSLPRRPK
jgi:phosphoglycerol transferase MdoB-like AlkP superfamily enzyme